jgi:hypothetical protein
MSEWGRCDATVRPHQRSFIDHADKRDVHRRPGTGARMMDPTVAASPSEGVKAASSRRAFILRRSWPKVRRIHHPKAGVSGARFRVATVGMHDQPAATGNRLDLALTVSVKDPRPAHSGPPVRMVNLRILDPGIPDAASELDVKFRARSEGLGSQHLRMLQLGIPSRLISCVDDEVEYRLSGCCDVDRVLDGDVVKVPRFMAVQSCLTHKRSSATEAEMRTSCGRRDRHHSGCCRNRATLE